MTLDELDRLHAEHEMQNQTVLRLDGRRYPDRHEYLHKAWPEVSARLRAAEAEVERLRGLCGEAASHIDPARWAQTADERAGSRARARAALVARLDRAALGEP